MKHLRLSLLMLTAALSMVLTACKQKEDPIVVVDMRYLLANDMNTQSEVTQVWDELHTLATLQGVVNRERPRLYIKYVINGWGDCTDEYWWNKYRAEGQWLAGRDTVQMTFDEAVAHFRKDIAGAVLYDPAVPSTSNVASTVAGADNLIAVRYDRSDGSVFSRFIDGGMRIPVKVRLINEDGTPMFTGEGTIPGTELASTGSIKDDPYYWMIEKYVKTGKLNCAFGGNYLDQAWLKNPKASTKNHHCLTNHDFFVSKKAFFFDLSPWGDEPATDDPTQTVGSDLNTLKALLLEAYKQNKGKVITHIGGFPAWAYKYTMHAGGKHDDVPTEWEYGRVISAYNAQMDADAIGLGALANASFWQHFPLNDSYPQQWITQKELKDRGLLDENGKVVLDKKYMIFYVGDYDASSWVAQVTPRIWDDPARGRWPLMWCISPVLAERSPQVLHYIRTTAGPNDYFAASDNGAGYLNPGELQEPRASGLPSGLDTWAAHCSRHYKKWGLTITGFEIDGYAPGLSEKGLDCYRSFSPNGIVPQKCPRLSLYKDMPVQRACWDIQNEKPEDAVKDIQAYIKANDQPFYWFRNILKTPQWYDDVMKGLSEAEPDLVLLDAPAYFELMRIYLKQNGTLE